VDEIIQEDRRVTAGTIAWKLRTRHSAVQDMIESLGYRKAGVRAVYRQPISAKLGTWLGPWSAPTSMTTGTTSRCEWNKTKTGHAGYRDTGRTQEK
jgi:hypothetical protein